MPRPNTLPLPVQETPSLRVRLEAGLAALAARLGRLPRSLFLAVSTVASLGLSILFFSPKFWLMSRPQPGTFEWDRALTFLRQCRAPFAAPVEAAMRWRLLPPLVAHALGLTGYSALILPYLGLIALVVFWCAAAERLLADRLSAFLLTLLLGTTAAVICVTTLYGLNDAWFLLGLVAVSAGRSRASLVLPGLLCPWVDERFLLGWASALFCRWWLQGRPVRFSVQAAWAAASLAPYALIRLTWTLAGHDHESYNFVVQAWSLLPNYLPYGRIGWWMGFRAAWLLLFLAGWGWWRSGGRPALFAGAGAAVVGWAAVTCLAADLCRSTNLLLPVFFCGAVALLRAVGTEGARRLWLGGLVLSNLALPFAFVSYNQVFFVWGLPIELLRLLRSRP